MTHLGRFATALILALGIPLSTTAQAGVMSGQDLIEICEPAPADPVYRLKMSECVGYIVGVSDTFDCENKALGFTWDSTTYKGQSILVEAVMEWLHLNPHVSHYQASGLVASALAKKFPCSKAVVKADPITP